MNPSRKGPGRLLRGAHWRFTHASASSELERLRERIERVELKRLLAQARAGREYCWLESEEETEPLVTIRIATFGRAELLRDRALASALRQTYRNIEILVVGDCTDEATDRMMRGIRDPRVRYVNLPHPSLYPPPPARWYVAGSVPMNVATLLARGSWLAPCDDDDEMLDDHVEVLLGRAKSTRVEFVHSRTERQLENGSWTTLGKPTLTSGEVTAGSVLYSLGLRFVPFSLTSWKAREPQDWNLWRRMRDIGVTMSYLDRVTYRYYWPFHATPTCDEEGDPLSSAMPIEVPGDEAGQQRP